MQIGDLVTKNGQMGIILQIAPHPSNLIQIKWFDGSFSADTGCWYHPDNLEHKWFPTQPTLIKSPNSET